MSKSSGQIRKARSGEGQFLTELALRSKAHWSYDKDFIEDCREELTLDPVHIENELVYVCEIDDTIVGYFAFEVVGRQAEMIALFVEPDYIGKGIGLMLWNHAVVVAKEKGWAKFKIVADPYAAERFYLKMGCIQVAELESSLRKGRKLPVLRYNLKDQDATN